MYRSVCHGYTHVNTHVSTHASTYASTDDYAPVYTHVCTLTWCLWSSRRPHRTSYTTSHARVAVMPAPGLSISDTATQVPVFFSYRVFACGQWTMTRRSDCWRLLSHIQHTSSTCFKHICQHRRRRTFQRIANTRANAHVAAGINTRVNTRVNTHVNPHVNPNAYTHVYTHVYTKVHTHVNTHIGTRVDTHVSTHTCRHTSQHTSEYTCSSARATS